MGFSFGFDEEGEALPDVQNVSKLIEQTCDETRPAELHSLSDILETFKGIRLSYEQVSNSIQLYRRQLHDVKHQLMMEDSMANNTHGDEFDILIGSSDLDLKKGVYEGGLKSWECAYDCIGYFSELNKFQELITQGNGSYIEVGCGTALPTMEFLQKILLNDVKNIKIVVTDYNYQVLRLVTVPNLFITWYLTTRGVSNSTNEILVTDELINEFIDQLSNSGISISIISGGWSSQWVSKVEPLVDFENCLFVTSETIYSPPIQPMLAQIVTKFWEKGAVCLVAGKDIYFGVGGTMEDFISIIGSNKVISRKRISGDVWRSILVIHK